MKITVTVNDVHIEDSYLVTKRGNMVFLLDDQKAKHPECNSFKRSDRSLTDEWRAHNLLYDLGLFRSHTKDVDLDFPTKWYTEIAYFVLSLFYFKGN